MDANSVVYVFGGGEFVRGNCQRCYLQQDWMFQCKGIEIAESHRVCGCRSLLGCYFSGEKDSFGLAFMTVSCTLNLQTFYRWRSFAAFSYQLKRSLSKAVLCWRSERDL